MGDATEKTTESTASHPLAFDRAGEPIDIHDDADSFRVVYFRKGEVVAVRDVGAGGGVLYLPLTATVEELAERSGPGVFKLVQVNSAKQTIKDAQVAYAEILGSPTEPTEESDEPAPPATVTGRLLDSLERSHEVTRASLDRVSTAFTEMGRTLGEALATLAKLASGQPIQPPVEVITEAPAPVGEQPDRVTPIVNLIKESLPMIMAAVASRAQAAQAQAGEQASQETTP